MITRRDRSFATTAAIIAAGFAILGMSRPVPALPLGEAAVIGALHADDASNVVDVRLGGGQRRAHGAGGGARAGNVSHANVNRNANVNTNVNRNVNRNANVNRTVGVGSGGWARPGNYWWRPGGAIAAGAAIGFVSAATAGAWAGAAPGPGMCWYYTDSSRTQGFWDACP